MAEAFRFGIPLGLVDPPVPLPRTSSCCSCVWNDGVSSDVTGVLPPSFWQSGRDGAQVDLGAANRSEGTNLPVPGHAPTIPLIYPPTGASF